MAGPALPAQGEGLEGTLGSIFIIIWFSYVGALLGISVLGPSSLLTSVTQSLTTCSFLCGFYVAGSASKPSCYLLWGRTSGRLNVVVKACSVFQVRGALEALKLNLGIQSWKGT